MKPLKDMKQRLPERPFGYPNGRSGYPNGRSGPGVVPAEGVVLYDSERGRSVDSSGGVAGDGS